MLCIIPSSMFIFPSDVSFSSFMHSRKGNRNPAGSRRHWLKIYFQNEQLEKACGKTHDCLPLTMGMSVLKFITDFLTCNVIFGEAEVKSDEKR